RQGSFPPRAVAFSGLLRYLSNQPRTYKIRRIRLLTRRPAAPWYSSGMRTITVSTLRSFSAWKYSSVWAIGVRRSHSPVISIVGALTLPTYFSGERFQCSSMSSQGSFLKFVYQYGPSVVPTKLIQLVTGNIDTAARKRLVCPTVQQVSTPPPEPP